MFSGIVEQLGRVEAIADQNGARRFTLVTGWDDLALGESVAVNGVCLTVAALDGRRADVFLSAETLERSNLGAVRSGGLVNMERALTLATRLSGHLVQGHVDGRARLTAVRAEGDSHRIELALPEALFRYCVEKGSIALNGVSLTLNRVDAPTGGRFAVAITLIPHTWTHTNLHACAAGDDLNVEVDVLAKYVERLCQPYPTPSPA
jgi:riboflavin synthase